MPRRLRNGLTIFDYFTAIGLLFFACRDLEFANRERVSPLAPLITALFTGAWMAALLFPLIARLARRFPFECVDSRSILIASPARHSSALFILPADLLISGILTAKCTG
jgi:hypothetical protein